MVKMGSFVDKNTQDKDKRNRCQEWTRRKKRIKLVEDYNDRRDMMLDAETYNNKDVRIDFTNKD